MKKMLLVFAAVALLCGCEKELPVMDDGSQVVVNEDWDGERNACWVTLRVAGDWESPAFSRSTMVSESNMTDLWVFDYMDGELVQTVHQGSDASGWGSPTLTLYHGQHQLCIVASRGQSPSVQDGVISWESVRDTFWKRLSVAIDDDAPDELSAVLDRVVARLLVRIQDEIPAEMSELVLQPDVWYYGLSVLTGQPADARSDERSVSVPASYVGTSGQLSVNIFCFSGNSEWTTDVDVFARDADDNIIGHAEIHDAPFLANRSTEYSGRMFTDEKGFALTLNDEWDEPWLGGW